MRILDYPGGLTVITRVLTRGGIKVREKAKWQWKRSVMEYQSDV